MKALSHACSFIGIVLSAIFIVTALALLPMHAWARQLVPGMTGNTQGSVTILVLDMSGSMAQNDPDGLRCSAANAFIDLSGPGNFIGVVGLNGDGTTGGTHDFPLAQTWAPPGEMATPLQRQSLQNTLREKSQRCQPQNTTPTYDALNKALDMLKQATRGGSLPGSVVLLTDGVPDPGTSAQINAIQSDLLPQFKQHSWGIDTIALGPDGPVPAGTPFQAFHAFLSGLSNATSGKFYDDAQGVIQGQPSPFNIAPFFVDIFARHNHRTLGDTIGLTQVDGSESRSFSVTNYTDNLDVVVLKDQPGTQVSLQDPSGHAVTAQPGVFVSRADPHYVIYSIDRPQPGSWVVNVNGSGQFLMKSLKTSSLGLSELNVTQANLQVSAQSALALGQPAIIRTNLLSHGEPVSDPSIMLNGHIAYNGTMGTYSQDFTLNDKNSPGTYMGTMNLPENAPAGSYDITVNAYTVSLSNPLGSQVRSVRIEHFPEPYLLSLPAHQPTTGEVALSAIQWDPVLRTLYSLPLANWLSSWPLQHFSVQPTADLTGQVELYQQPYSGGEVRAELLAPGEHVATPVNVINEGGGRFHLPLSVARSGLYTVVFHTRGSFAESYGDFGTIQRQVRITLTPANWTQELFAWFVTALYGLLLLILLLFIRFCVLPHPFGEARASREGEYIGSVRFNRARRGPFQRLLRPNLLRSLHAGMPAGLCFRFKRGGGIEVRPEGQAANWQKGDGAHLQPSFQEEHELHYRPAGSDDPVASEEPVIYRVASSPQAGASAEENETLSAGGWPEYEEERWSTGPFADEDNDNATQKSRRERRGKRANEGEFDW
ncbi:hypothetical protein KSF_110730 [Reticulibacter mediterranei]|uniref:VWFA domain-containing protein n=1 Tax=Reticulibacter mediterranei TaxID=2778369 RepID=A0A8J3J2B9_9CHLR|nr:vWA domain-containing protein [Reticulibacter mediterranei]GHP01026.1 hypothetical protein KSF_110730 [Reticulibacter mediterranei]